MRRFVLIARLLFFNVLISSERSKRLLRRLSVMACKQVFFTDEKMFYINPPVSTQNDRCGLLAENVMSLQVGC